MCFSCAVAWSVIVVTFVTCDRGFVPRFWECGYVYKSSHLHSELHLINNKSNVISVTFFSSRITNP